MSSNASTAESGVSAETAIIGIDSASTKRTRFDVEREILCNYIEALEQELTRERQRREQVVEHYEQLLDAEQQTENDSTSLLQGLF